MLELSHHSVNMMHTCPKKFYWTYLVGLEPIVRTVNLTLGTVMHEAFDLFYRGESDNGVYAHIKRRFDEEIKNTELADQESLRIAQYIALGMWLAYPAKDLSEFTKIHSEEEFKVDLLPGVQFVGRVDGRVHKQGVWWVRELKTTSLPVKQFQGRTTTSPQATGYVYGLRKLGIDIRGLVYDYIKKPLLRKGVNENVDGYGSRIVKDYKDRPKYYYFRHYAFRTTYDLELFEADTMIVAGEIKDRVAHNRFPRNQDACWTYGSECPFAKICFVERPDPLTVQLYFNQKTPKIGGGEDDRGEEGSGKGTGGKTRSSKA